jgi:hypothetical protein
MSAAAALAYLTAPLKDGQDDRIASSPLLRTQSLSRPSIPFPSRYLGSKYIVMSGEFLCCSFSVRPSDEPALSPPPGIPMCSRTSHLGAQHSFDSCLGHHPLGWLPTRCQGKLLDRLVRLSITITYPREPRSTQLIPSFSFPLISSGMASKPVTD